MGPQFFRRVGCLSHSGPGLAGLSHAGGHCRGGVSMQRFLRWTGSRRRWFVPPDRMLSSRLHCDDLLDFPLDRPSFRRHGRIVLCFDFEHSCFPQYEKADYGNEGVRADPQCKPRQNRRGMRPSSHFRRSVGRHFGQLRDRRQRVARGNHGRWRPTRRFARRLGGQIGKLHDRMQRNVECSSRTRDRRNFGRHRHRLDRRSDRRRGVKISTRSRSAHGIFRGQRNRMA